MNDRVQDSLIAWHISSYSDGADANCVEAGPVIDGSGRVAVRDSTRRHAGLFVATGRSWRRFTSWVGRR